jgi:hypothetical protein
MGTDVAKFFGGHNLPAAKSNLSQALAGFSAAKHALMGKALLRLTKQGIWVFGQDNEILKAGARLVANPASVASGYVAWYMAKIEGEIMQPITQGPVDPNKLGPVSSGSIPPGKDKPSGRGWEDQISVDLLTQTDPPLQMVYKTSSLGGKKAILTLAGEISMGVDENPKRAYPVIELGTDSYIHPEYSTIFTPDLRIVAWLDDAGEPVVDAPLLAEKRGLV